MAELRSDRVVVVTDTLITDMALEPTSFATKCNVIPHLNMLVTGVGTGTWGLSQDWLTALNVGLLAPMMGMESLDVEGLNVHTPGVLRRMRDESDDLAGSGESAIYQFGFAEGRACYVGYAYRSADDFESEEIPHGTFFVHPGPAGAFQSPSPDFAEWIELAHRVRGEQQSAYPDATTVCIGGELIANVMSNGSVQTAKIYRWPDFDEHWRMIQDRWRKLQEFLSPPPTASVVRLEDSAV